MRRLNGAIDRWERQHQTRLTSTELVTRLAEHGQGISLAYMSQLRTGRRRQPSPELLIALGRALGVPSEYFTHQYGAPPTTPDEIVSGLSAGGLRRLLSASVGLSAESLDYLNEVAERFRRAERLPAENQTAEWVLRTG